MKKQILSILLLAVAIVLFNSCEKENTTNDVVAIDTDAPKAPYETSELDGPVTELELPTSKESDTALEEDFTDLKKDTNVVQARDYTINIGNYSGASIGCGTYFTGSLYGARNKITNWHYANMLISTDLDGGDQIYILNVTQRSNVSINMTNTTQNLAMSLFRGIRRCISNSTTGLNCELSLINWVAGTSSSSLYGDYLGPVTLEPGEYVLIVDSRAGYPSTFSLSVNCTPVQPSCVSGAYTLLYDNFQNYYLGALEPRSVYWRNYFPTSTNYAEVAQNAAGNKYMYVAYRPGTTGITQVAPMLQFGTRTTGIYTLKMKLWIYRNRSALIGTVKNYTGNPTLNQIGAYLRFDPGANGIGSGTIMVGGCTSGNNCQRFTFPHDQWMDVQLDIVMYGTAPQTFLRINGELKGSWRTDATYTVNTGERRIDGITFFSPYSNTQYFVDDVCFSRYP